MTILGGEQLTTSRYDMGRRFERRQCVAELRSFIEVCRGHVNGGMIRWLEVEAQRMGCEGQPLTYAEMTSLEPLAIEVSDKVQEVDG